MNPQVTPQHEGSHQRRRYSDKDIVFLKIVHTTTIMIKRYCWNHFQKLKNNKNIDSQSESILLYTAPAFKVADGEIGLDRVFGLYQFLVLTALS